MHSTKIRNIIAGGEGLKVEFKRNFNNDTIVTINAFANKKIAAIFKEAGIIEKYGSGIQRVIQAFKNYNLSVPEFENFKHGFRVIIKTPQKTPPKAPPKKSLGDKIIDLLKKNNKLSQQDIANNLNLSIYTVKEYITKLRKEGKLIHIGSKRSGYWNVIDENE